MSEKARHPCFDPQASATSARVHLPVAKSCNMRCGYCNAADDCANESRPGLASAVLTPYQAVEYLGKVMEKMPVTVAGIAGPGDPFAEPARSLETLALVHERFPDLILCLASNGLALADHVDEIARIGVSHVTVTVNSVDPRIGAMMYDWIRVGPYRHSGIEAALTLFERQDRAIRALKEKGMTVKLNTVIVPGVNDRHIASVAAKAREWGVDYMNCMALIPVPGARFQDRPSPSHDEMAMHRMAAGAFVKQMSHCRRCRADAAGLLDEAKANGAADLLREAAGMPAKPDNGRKRVAVASREGAMVSSHLGECRDFLIYEPFGSSYRSVETRRAPEAGTPDRWQKLAEALSDCSLLLASGAGKTPTEELSKAGIEVSVVEGMIDQVLDAIARGRRLASFQRLTAGACRGGGAGC
jgi:nitrogen fixation protein NifB